MLTIQTRKQAYAPGETVVLTMHWKNQSGVTQKLTFATAQRFDLLLLRDGQKVWQWSERQAFPQWGTTLWIEPGESRCFKAEWPQVDHGGEKVPAGRYKVQAWLVAQPNVLAEAEIEVEAQRVLLAGDKKTMCAQE